jgi:glucokinase
VAEDRDVILAGDIGGVSARPPFVEEGDDRRPPLQAVPVRMILNDQTAFLGAARLVAPSAAE